MRYFMSIGGQAGLRYSEELVRQIRKFDPLATFEGYRQCDPLRPSVPKDGPWRVVGWKAPDQPPAVNIVRSHPRNIIRAFRESQADAVILLEHRERDWKLAEVAGQMGVPCFSFVPPQSWAARSIAPTLPPENVHILCTLPFEEMWYSRRGFENLSYVGHPHFDLLDHAMLDQAFVFAQNARTHRRVVALLPGSKAKQLPANMRLMAKVATDLCRRIPNVRFLVGLADPTHVELLAPTLRRFRLPLELHAGRTLEIVELADVAVAAPGLISLELLHFARPTVFTCSIPPLLYQLAKRTILQSPYAALPNLFAGRELQPEFVGRMNGSAQIGTVLADWLSDDHKLALMRTELQRLRSVYGQPGACLSAAETIWSLMNRSQQHLRLRAA